MEQLGTWDPGYGGLNELEDTGVVNDLPTPLVRSFLFDLTRGVASNVRPVKSKGDRLAGFGFELSVAGGVVTAALSAELTNRTDPATRVKDEWQNGRYAIPDITGYLIGHASDPAIAAYGVGREVFTGPNGVDVNIVPIWFTAAPLPSSVTPESLLVGN